MSSNGKRKADDEGGQKKVKKEKKYDPKQSSDERRKLRSDLREMKQYVKDNKSELHQAGSKKLTEVLSNSDATFKKIGNTREAAIEASLLVDLLKEANQAVATIDSSLALLNPPMCRDKVNMYLNQTVAPKDDIQKGQNKRWADLGKIALAFSRTLPAIQFMHGPLSMDVTKVVRRQAKRREKMDESLATKAEDGVDEEYEKNADTDIIIKEIVAFLEARFWKWYDDNDGPEYGTVPVAELIINPASYAQTVENLFYLSNAVTNKVVRLHFNDEGQYCAHFKPIAAEILADPDMKEALGVRLEDEKQQGSMVIEFTHEMWQNAIKTFGVKKPLITNRDYSDLE